MLRCGGARGMLRRFRRNNRLPQDTATQRIRYEQTLKLFRKGQQFLAITALLLSASTLIFYIETRYETVRQATVTAQFCDQFGLWFGLRLGLTLRVAWSLGND